MCVTVVKHEISSFFIITRNFDRETRARYVRDGIFLTEEKFPRDVIYTGTADLALSSTPRREKLREENERRRAMLRLVSRRRRDTRELARNDRVINNLRTRALSSSSLLRARVTSSISASRIGSEEHIFSTPFPPPLPSSDSPSREI